MTSAHFIYIPLMIIVGMVLGFVLGTRFARDQIAAREKREAEREKRRAERAAARAARASEAPKEP